MGENTLDRTEYKKEYSIQNKEKLNEQTRQWHKTNPERSMYVTARARARSQGVPFEIETEDIIIPEVCPVLGIPIFVSEGKRTDNTPSLDKIKRELGYVKGNIAVISWRANRLKCDATLEEMRQILAYMDRKPKVEAA